MVKQAKTEIVMVRLTLDDKQAFQKAAEKEDMTVSEYMRAATLAYMAVTFNKRALQAALRGGMELLKEFEEEGRKQFFSTKVKD